jgi:phospholipase C
VTPPPPSPEPTPAPDAEKSLARLRSVKHIVVLMMENRSFDQMLGFLEGEGLDVDGLGSAKANSDAGNLYEPFEWGPGETAFKPPPGHKAKILDPCHSPHCVHEQLANDSTGFVKNFAASRKDEQDNSIELDPEYLKVPMGHYGAQHLPVYRHLAHNFCVCDAWHSSIPGDTWPNRLYSIAGREGPSVGHKPGVLGDLLKEIKGLPVLGGLDGAPIFEVEAFTRQLHDSQWRWYSHDPATLRAADSLYRDFRHINRDNFAYFNRKKLSLQTRALEAAIVGHDSFLDDAAKGQLRDVSWIDPNFIDLSILDPNSNDDHPPSDVKAGQALVLELYEALANSPNWEDTVLVITYDEHGGFYDHVKPPAIDDHSGYATLGVRVPALVVGPRVKQFVSHQTFEHTSLIATILRRFATHPEQALRAMPERVHKAPHLGVLLEDEPRKEIEGHGQLREEITKWRAASRNARRAHDGSSEAADGAGHPLELHDFQHEFAQFVLAMRDAGLPPGQP